MTTATATSSLPATAAGWGPSRRLSLKQANARSRLVHTMRFVFVGLAAASLASVFVYTTAYSMAGGFTFQRPAEATASITMVQPRFTGRLDQDATFQLTADDASRDGPNDGPISLNAPVYRETSGRIVLAPSGAYDAAAGHINLTGGVTFTDGSGNRFTSQNADIDVENRVLRGNAEIIGDGPLGVVRADAYELYTDGGRFVFRGNVRGVLPERGRPAQPAAAAPQESAPPVPAP